MAALTPKSVITNIFQEILKEPNRKPNKTWGDQGSEILQ